VICLAAAMMLGLEAQSLRLDKTIPLPDVQGRIDHLSVDLAKRRLFVAALGNNTVEVIDLAAGTRLHTIPGLHEPQGLFYLAGADRLYVAGGGDGTLRIYNASSFQLIRTIECGDDADNVRYDARANRIWVGYGSGALAAFTPDGERAGTVPLDAHPESFQLEKSGARIFVNLPKSKKIAVVDRNTMSVTASWHTGGPQSNYPMTLDEADHLLFVVCRQPARIIAFDTQSGKVLETLPAVGDSDDVFFDAASRRIFATGGSGAIWVYDLQPSGHLRETVRIPTVEGARTALLIPDLGWLCVAARRQSAQPAAIRVYALK
jgi:DNA-binding beta-propeller fold protein YncE